MTQRMTRRQAIVAVAPVVWIAGRAAAQPDSTLTAADAPDSFPAQDQRTVKEMVGACHGNIERVSALLKEQPRLANAAYDWGFGDWETSLGAAAHTGRRNIAALLIEHGARPDITVPYDTNGRSTLGVWNGVAPKMYSEPGLGNRADAPQARPVVNIIYYGSTLYPSSGFGGAMPREPNKLRPNK